MRLPSAERSCGVIDPQNHVVRAAVFIDVADFYIALARTAARSARHRGVGYGLYAVIIGHKRFTAFHFILCRRAQAGENIDSVA